MLKKMVLIAFMIILILIFPNIVKGQELDQEARGNEYYIYIEDGIAYYKHSRQNIESAETKEIEGLNQKVARVKIFNIGTDISDTVFLILEDGTVMMLNNDIDNPVIYEALKNYKIENIISIEGTVYPGNELKYKVKLKNGEETEIRQEIGAIEDQEARGNEYYIYIEDGIAYYKHSRQNIESAETKKIEGLNQKVARVKIFNIGTDISDTVFLILEDGTVMMLNSDIDNPVIYEALKNYKIENIISIEGTVYPGNELKYKVKLKNGEETEIIQKIENKKEDTDKTLSNDKLPNTGIESLAIITVVVLGIVYMFLYKKVKEYKNI